MEPLVAVAKRPVVEMAPAPSDSPRAVESIRMVVAPAPRGAQTALSSFVFSSSRVLLLLRFPARAHWLVVLLSIPSLLPAGLELA